MSPKLLLLLAVLCRGPSGGPVAGEFTYTTIEPDGSSGAGNDGPDPDTFVPLASGQLNVLSSPVTPADFLPLPDDRPEIDLEIPQEILQNFANHFVGPSRGMLGMAMQALSVGLVDKWFQAMHTAFDYMEKTLVGLDLPGLTESQAAAAADAGSRLTYPRNVVESVMMLAEARESVALRAGTPPPVREGLLRHVLRARRVQYAHTPARSPVRVLALDGAARAYYGLGRYCDAVELWNGYVVGLLRKPASAPACLAPLEDGSCADDIPGVCFLARADGSCADAAVGVPDVAEDEEEEDEDVILPVPTEEEVRSAATTAVLPLEIRRQYADAASYCSRHYATGVGLYEEMLLANVINPERPDECPECWGNLHVLRAATGRQEESALFFQHELAPHTPWAHPDQLPVTFDARLGYHEVHDLFDDWSEPRREPFIDPHTSEVAYGLLRSATMIATEFAEYERIVDAGGEDDDEDDASRSPHAEMRRRRRAEEEARGEAGDDDAATPDAFQDSHPFAKFASHAPEGSYNILDLKETSDGRKGRNWNRARCGDYFPATCGSLQGFREVNARGVPENRVDASAGCRGRCAAVREERDGTVLRPDPPAFHRLAAGVGRVAQLGESNQVLTCRLFVRGRVGSVRMVVGSEEWVLSRPHEVVCFDGSYVHELVHTYSVEDGTFDTFDAAAQFPLVFLEVNYWNPELLLNPDGSPTHPRAKKAPEKADAPPAVDKGKCLQYNKGTGNASLDKQMGIEHTDADCIRWENEEAGSSEKAQGRGAGANKRGGVKAPKKCLLYGRGTGNAALDQQMGIVHTDDDCLEWEGDEKGGGAPGGGAQGGGGGGGGKPIPVDQDGEPRLRMAGMGDDDDDDQDGDDDDMFGDDDDFSAFAGYEE